MGLFGKPLKAPVVPKVSEEKPKEPTGENSKKKEVLAKPKPARQGRLEVKPKLVYFSDYRHKTRHYVPVGSNFEDPAFIFGMKCYWKGSHWLAEDGTRWNGYGYPPWVWSL